MNKTWMVALVLLVGCAVETAEPGSAQEAAYAPAETGPCFDGWTGFNDCGCLGDNGRVYVETDEGWSNLNDTPYYMNTGHRFPGDPVYNAVVCSTSQGVSVVENCTNACDADGGAGSTTLCAVYAPAGGGETCGTFPVHAGCSVHFSYQQAGAAGAPGACMAAAKPKLMASTTAD